MKCIDFLGNHPFIFECVQQGFFLSPDAPVICNVCCHILLHVVHLARNNVHKFQQNGIKILYVSRYHRRHFGDEFPRFFDSFLVDNKVGIGVVLRYRGIGKPFQTLNEMEYIRVLDAIVAVWRNRCLRGISRPFLRVVFVPLCLFLGQFQVVHIDRILKRLNCVDSPTTAGNISVASIVGIDEGFILITSL